MDMCMTLWTVAVTGMVTGSSGLGFLDQRAFARTAQCRRPSALRLQPHPWLISICELDAAGF